MITIIRQNCKGFININTYDSRAAMLIPLALLTDSERFENEEYDSTIYGKACDLYHALTGSPEKPGYCRFSLLAAELKMKYADKALKRYNILSMEELEYIMDFIDTYGGFSVYQ